MAKRRKPQSNEGTYTLRATETATTWDNETQEWGLFIPKDYFDSGHVPDEAALLMAVQMRLSSDAAFKNEMRGCLEKQGIRPVAVEDKETGQITPIHYPEGHDTRS